MPSCCLAVLRAPSKVYLPRRRRHLSSRSVRKEMAPVSAATRSNLAQGGDRQPLKRERIDVVSVSSPWRVLRAIVRGHRFGDASRASFNLTVSSVAITRIQCGPSHGIVTGVARFFDAPMLFVFGGFSFTRCRQLEHCIATRTK